MTIATNTIRVDTFQVVYNLVNANLPVGWTLRSVFPEVEPTYPIILINPASIRTETITQDGIGKMRMVELEIEFFAKGSQGKKKIDEGRDAIQQIIEDNQSSLSTDGLEYGDELIDDSNVNLEEINDQRVNTAVSVLRLIQK